MNLRILGTALLIALGLSVPAHAQQPAPEDLSAQVEAWSKELDTRETAIEENRTNESALEAQRKAIEKIAQKIEKFPQSLEPRINELKSQIENLGPAPAKDAEPEPEGIALERGRLNALLGELQTASKIAGIQLTHASQLIGKIQTHRRNLFARQLFKRQQSPLSPRLWKTVAQDAEFGWRQLRNLLDDNANWIGSRERVAAIVVGMLLAWLSLRWLARRGVERWRAPANGSNRALFEQAGSIVWVVLARMAPLVLVVATAYFVLLGLDALSPQTDRLGRSVVLAVFVFAAVTSLSRTLLEPRRTEWRMVPLTDASARRLAWLIPLGAVIHGVTQVGAELSDVLISPVSLTLAQNIVACLIFAGVLAAILLTPMHAPERAASPPSRLWPKWLKLPLWLATIGIFVTTLLGYIALARFLTEQIINTGLIVILGVLLYSTISALSENFGDSERPEGAWLKARMKLDEPRRRQIAYAVSFSLNLLLLLAVAPLLLLQWGYSWSEIHGWLIAAFFGFDLGSFRLSIAMLLIAAGLFVAGILITRQTQRWLDRGPLNIARVDQGIAHSVRTGVGYLGFILSALLAVSYVGFDFTNVAIIAGALSVGIGFGLQSIINNFVSGLILLVERPIKVGDWVIVGDKQGLVRRISVRATIIETFDRSSLIIPNSELITGTVVNWTHGDSVARVIINVGVSYSSDTQAVYDLLMEIGHSHPKTLEIPKPRVVFEDFGDSSLNFSLRVYIADVMEQLELRTDLRLEILKRFREADIEIPFPQRDLHIKSGLPVSLAEAM